MLKVIEKTLYTVGEAEFESLEKAQEYADTINKGEGSPPKYVWMVPDSWLSKEVIKVLLLSCSSGTRGITEARYLLNDIYYTTEDFVCTEGESEEERKLLEQVIEKRDAFYKARCHMLSGRIDYIAEVLLDDIQRIGDSRYMEEILVKYFNEIRDREYD